VKHLNETTSHEDDSNPSAEADATEKSYSPYAQVNPEQVIEPEDAMEEARLEDLPESVQNAAHRVGWSSLTPVQAKAIPDMVERRDLMVQSRAGSGKTGAFLLPVSAELDPSHNYCQALILVPTRELAVQVEREAQLLGGEAGI